MFKQEVQNQIQQHYDKLISLGYNVVGVFLYGSQNYELVTLVQMSIQKQ